MDALVAEGAARASTPAEVASASDVVITMVPDTPDVELVLFGEAGVAEGATAGSLVIDMSTIDPIRTRAFAERLAANDVAMLDAPVSGGQVGAEAGTLSIMVGGPGRGVRAGASAVRGDGFDDRARRSVRVPGRSRRPATSS